MRRSMKFMMALVLYRHFWRDHMLKAFGAALLLVSASAMTADPARALQVVVTQVDKNTDGSMTYHFAVKTDPGETLTPGASRATGDFVTVYNFYGLIDGSAKVPAGWEFSSEASGRTPELGGYPLVFAGGRSEYAQPDLDGSEAGRCGGADRRLHRDYPREHNSGGPVHGAGHAPGAPYRRRRHRNAGCRRYGVQTGAHRRAADAELPR